jgi:hypothetical protein
MATIKYKAGAYDIRQASAISDRTALCRPPGSSGTSLASPISVTEVKNVM